MTAQLRDALLGIFGQVKYITAWQVVQSVLLMAILATLWSK